MIYKVKFNINGGLKGMPYLEKGDEVEIVNAKNMKFRVEDVWTKDNEQMYRLGAFGLVRLSELEMVK